MEVAINLDRQRLVTKMSFSSTSGVIHKEQILMSFIQEQILKTIVFEINEVVKKNKRNHANKKSSSLKEFINENFCKNKDKNPINQNVKGIS